MIGTHAKDLKQRLLTMPPQQFAQFAQQHKDDATVFPLVYEVGKLRKAAQSQQALQQQQGPTVADQALQEITMPPQMAQQLAYAQPQPQPQPQPQGQPGQNLPENTGIAAAAPPSAGRFAHGGIVGFAGDDPRVGSYVDEGGIMRVSGNPENIGPYANARPKTSRELWAGQPSMLDYLTGFFRSPEQREEASEYANGIVTDDVKARLAREGRGVNLGEQVRPEPPTVGFPDPRVQAGLAAGYGYGENGVKNSPSTAMPPTTAPAAAPATAAPQGTGVGTPPRASQNGAGARVGVGVGIGVPPGAGGVPPPSFKLPAEPTFSKLSAATPAPQLKYDTEGEEREREAGRRIGELATGASRENREAFERDLKARGEYGAAREARLKEAEGKLEGEKESASGRALLTAGLAILGAPGGRGFGYAVAQAIPAITQYGVDMDKLEARRDKLRESMDNLEDIRFKMKDADSRELRGYKAKERETLVQVAKDAATLESTLTGRRAAINMKNAELLTEAYKVERQAESHQVAAENQAKASVYGSNAQALSSKYGHELDAISRENAARISASAHVSASRNNQLEYLQALRDPQLFALHMQTHPTEKKHVAELFSGWLKENPMMQARSPAEQISAFMATMNGLGVGSKVPSTTTTPAKTNRD